MYVFQIFHKKKQTAHFYNPPAAHTVSEIFTSPASFNRIYFSVLHAKCVKSVAEAMRQVKESSNGNAVRALRLNQRR